jgi:restriction endonuclease S subunit
MSPEVILSEVVDIKLGQTFRGKAEAIDNNNNIKLIQIKDIKEGEISSLSNLSYANLDLVKLKVRLQYGDLLLPLRGSRNEAALFKVSETGTVVTTTNQVAILRPKTIQVRQHFLLWYFNSGIGALALDSIKTGTTVPSINSKELANLKLFMPNIEVQDKIINLYSNWSSQKDVLKSLEDTGEELLNKLCLNLISNKSG